MDSLRVWLDIVSQWAIPALVLLIIVWAAVKRVPTSIQLQTSATMP